MRRIQLLFVLAIICYPLFAVNLQLPSIFSDNMVLQRNMQNPIWGKASPNSIVTIQINQYTLTVKSSNSGDWKAKLPLLNINEVYSLTILNQEERKQFSNIVVGDVYYMGGQSNMQFALKKSIGGIEATHRTAYPSIRLFKVPQAISYTPRFDLDIASNNDKYAGSWFCSDSLSARDFSAIGFYLAEILHREEKIPIGIIQISWGGTPIEAHSSLSVNKHFCDFKQDLKLIRSKRDSDTLSIDKTKNTPQLPSSIFNAMINPIVPYGIKALVWYQGEHNWNHPLRYKKQLRAMIADIRKRWLMPTMPVFIVQLPNIGKRDSVLRDYNWAILRESQAKVASMPHNQLCVTIDLGGDGDLHPKNKYEVAVRLSELIRKNLYFHTKKDISPTFKSYKLIDNQIELSFSDVSTGFCSKDSITGFAICGSDHKFVWANAKIAGNKVLVSHPKITKPKAVRYAWGGNPTFNLFNSEGYPIAPFRTDNFRVPKDGKW